MMFIKLLRWISLVAALLVVGCDRTVSGPALTAMPPSDLSALPTPTLGATAITPTPSQINTPMPTSLAISTPSPTIVVNTAIPNATPSPTPTFTVTPTRGPAPVGTPDLAAPFIQGNYAYIGHSKNDNSDLLVLDISDPANPLIVGRFFTSYANIISTRVVDRYVYILRENGIQIVDISNPTTPYLVSSYHVGRNVSVFNIVDDSIYVVEAGFLHIIDISDPRTPRQVSSLQILEEGSLYYVQGLVVIGDYIYLPACYSVRSTSYGTIHIVNVSIPSEPYIIGNYDLLEDRAVCLRIVGGEANVIYLAGHYHGQNLLWKLDITDPAVPRLVDQFNIPQPQQVLKIVGQYAYGTEFFPTIFVTDISDLLDSTTELTVITSNNRADDDMSIVDHYVYLWKSYPPLLIFDISDPNNPILVHLKDF